MGTVPTAPCAARLAQSRGNDGRYRPNPTARAILDELHRRPDAGTVRYVDGTADDGARPGVTVVGTDADSPVVVHGDEPRPGSGPVLVALDDDANPAELIAYGRAEARRRGVALRTVHVWTDCRPPDCYHHRACHGDLGGAVRLLSHIIGWHLPADDASDVERYVLHATDPAQALATLSGSASLLVLGAASRGPGAEGLLGDTTRALVARTRCPLAVVPHRAAAVRGGRSHAF